MAGRCCVQTRKTRVWLPCAPLANRPRCRRNWTFVGADNRRNRPLLTAPARIPSLAYPCFKTIFAMNSVETIDRPRWVKSAKRACSLVVAGSVALAHFPSAAVAQDTRGLPVIRDAEIEQLLREYTTPILK